MNREMITVEKRIFDDIINKLEELTREVKSLRNDSSISNVVIRKNRSKISQILLPQRLSKYYELIEDLQHPFYLSDLNEKLKGVAFCDIFTRKANHYLMIDFGGYEKYNFGINLSQERIVPDIEFTSINLTSGCFYGGDYIFKC